MRKLSVFLVMLLGISYPFLVYWGLQSAQTRWLLPLLLLSLALRWVVLGQTVERRLILSIAIVVCVVVVIAGRQFGLKFYPVAMNLGFFILFASSLFTPVSFVEKLARLKQPELPTRAIQYTRRVTQVWSAFFVVNGTIACLTAVAASDEIWLLYNGFIAYILMGILAASEWLVRRRIIEA